jgi:hypothetical protein
VKHRKTRIQKMFIAVAAMSIGFVCHAYGQRHSSATDELRKGFAAPPSSARLRCYWWWLNGHTTKATITRDLEEMQKKNYGGVLLVDANGADQNGNDSVPAGPEFGSPEWTTLYVHALKEANRLGLEVTLNITSGWNLGGPWVQPEQASKLLTWSRTPVRAGEAGPVTLPSPPAKNGFYRQIAVLAYPLHHGTNLPGSNGDSRKPLSELALKSAAAEGNFSMPDLTRLLFDESSEARNDKDTDLSEVHDITSQVDTDGVVHWSRPLDNQSWEILRIGYTDSGARVSTSSGAWQGLAIDYLDPTALDQYWNKTVLPLLTVAKPYLGRSLKYLASDSWELGGTNWTGNFRQEFRKRRGYDPIFYLPIVSGRIVGSRELSTRFLADLRRTVADLINDHYDHLALLSSRFGLGIQCESGGPHGAPFDALETFRSSAIPQTEYWAMSPDHRRGDSDRFFVKEAASAAHIYGRPFAAAEGMTSIGNQWNESLGMNLKPSFDQALTEGMNRLVWHEFTSSPPELGLPGQEYFAGTHLNPNVTWWRDAGQFTQYLNRAQFLLQQGSPVADVLYYYGDNVPNFVRLKRDDPARVLPGFDYDVTSTDGLLHHLSVTSGILQTTAGIRYRALALPRSRILPLAVLELVQRYVQAGGVLIGIRPIRSQGVVPEADSRKFDQIADALWTACEKKTDHHVTIGKGQVVCIESSRDALEMINVSPDFEAPKDQVASLDYIHRRSADGDIYFIRNTQPKTLQTTVTLRVNGKQPEIFDAVTGEIHQTLLFSATADHRTSVPLALEPYGSVFLLFRRPVARNNVISIAHDDTILYSSEYPDKMQLPPALTVENDGGGTPVLQTPESGAYQATFSSGEVKRVNAERMGDIPLSNNWTLDFPRNWGAPPELHLHHLQSWTESTDAGVRYFSGTATYKTIVSLTNSQLAGENSIWLDLGEVHEVAAVRINSSPAAILWKAPYSLRADRLLHAGENTIEIDITNLWPNRLIGDAQSPDIKHYTWTNIRKYNKDSPLLPSGLLGPVRLRTVYRLPLQ